MGRPIDEIKILREATNRLSGKNRHTMENILNNYERKGEPEEMLDSMAALMLIFLEELEEEKLNEEE